MDENIDFRTRKWKMKKLKNQPVSELLPLCRKWTPRGYGLEMRSVISTTALSLHYLHSYKFSRCFGGYDYLSGSAREADLTPSLCRYLHQRHHLRLFQRFRQKITSTSTLLNFLWYIRPCKPLQSPQFNHIQSLFDYNFFISFEKCIFSVAKLRHIVSSFHIFHVCFTPTFISV